MKRASLDFHQSYVDDKEVRARFKHQTLLQEYLELQKEFVSNKKKLQTSKQKRDTLFAEIGFLRRRRKYLLKIQSARPELDNDLVHLPNSDLHRKMLEKGRNLSAYGAAFGNRNPVLVSNPDLIDKEEREAGEEQVLRREQILKKMLTVKKKPSKSYFIDEKKVNKKKISWQDPMTLKV